MAVRTRSGKAVQTKPLCSTRGRLIAVKFIRLKDPNSNGRPERLRASDAPMMPSGAVRQLRFQPPLGEAGVPDRSLADARLTPAPSGP